MRYSVRVAWETVEIATATVEIEASSREEAEELVQEGLHQGEIDPDWSKPEITNGEQYVIEAQLVEEV